MEWNYMPNTTESFQMSEVVNIKKKSSEHLGEDDYIKLGKLQDKQQTALSGT